MLRLIFTSLFIAVSFLQAQFKYSVGLGAGVTFPDYTQFNHSIADSGVGELGPGWFPLNYEFSVQVYPSVRIGYLKLSNSLLPNEASNDFVLVMVMRGISLQTFFTFFKRFEANFGIVPMLGKAEFLQRNLEVKTEPFLFSASTQAGTTNSVFGFYSWTGVRMYLGSSLAVEANVGYFRAKFKGDKWKSEGDGNGISGNIDLTRPAFRFSIVIGW